MTWEGLAYPEASLAKDYADCGHRGAGREANSSLEVCPESMVIDLKPSPVRAPGDTTSPSSAEIQASKGCNGPRAKPIMDP